MKLSSRTKYLLLAFVLVDLLLFANSFLHLLPTIPIFSVFLVNCLIAGLYFYSSTKPFVLKVIFLIGYATANTVIGIVLVVSTMFIPNSKEHNYVMYHDCFPALRAYYGVGEGEPLPASSEVDANGNAKWWYQHLECEQNVYAGKGPVFSDNPQEFVPVKKSS